jgi:hypothetical protein
MPTDMRKAVVGVGILLLLAVAVLLVFPWTYPPLIRVKVKMFGPAPVIRALAQDDERWDVVVQGVRSGRTGWFRAAADMYDGLDTHPGEEMFEAVAVAFDANPDDAVRILAPKFGADLVCAAPPEWSLLTDAEAKRRLERLQLSALASSPSGKLCQQALSRRILTGK